MCFVLVCHRLPSVCSAECAEAFVPLAQDCYDQADLASLEGVDPFVAQCESQLSGPLQTDGNCTCSGMDRVLEEVERLRQFVLSGGGHTPTGGHTPAAGSGENLACTCSLCATMPADLGRCLPWTEDPAWATIGPGLVNLPGHSPVEPCECRTPADSAAQPFPVQAAGRPPCCRLEWPALATVTVVSGGGSTRYDQPQVDVKVGAKVTFEYSDALGFENVQEVCR